jgi:hypothetical protein
MEIKLNEIESNRFDASRRTQIASNKSNKVIERKRKLSQGQIPPWQCQIDTQTHLRYAPCTARYASGERVILFS